MKIAGHKYCHAMYEICMNLCTDTLETIKNNPIRKLVQSVFPLGVQDDSLWFILHLFNVLQEEQISKSTSFKSDMYDDYDSAWKGYQSKFATITDKLFTGMYQKNIKCNGCSNVDKVFEIFIHTALDLETDNLQGAIDNYLSFEDHCEARCDK